MLLIKEDQVGQTTSLSTSLKKVCTTCRSCKEDTKGKFCKLVTKKGVRQASSLLNTD